MPAVCVCMLVRWVLLVGWISSKLSMGRSDVDILSRVVKMIEEMCSTKEECCRQWLFTLQHCFVSRAAPVWASGEITNVKV